MNLHIFVSITSFAKTDFECSKTPCTDVMPEFIFCWKSIDLLTATNETKRNAGLVSRASWQALFIWNPFFAILTELKGAEFLLYTKAGIYVIK